MNPTFCHAPKSINDTNPPYREHFQYFFPPSFVQQPTLINRPELRPSNLVQQNNNKRKGTHNEDPQNIIGVTKKHLNEQAPRTRTRKKPDESITNENNASPTVFKRAFDQMGRHYPEYNIPPQLPTQLYSGKERSINQTNTLPKHHDFHPTQFENTPYNHGNPPTHRLPIMDASVQHNYNSMAQKHMYATNNMTANNVTTMQNKEMLPIENFIYNNGFDNDPREHLPSSQPREANNEPSVASFATMLGRDDNQCFKHPMSMMHDPKLRLSRFNNHFAMEPSLEVRHYNNTSQLESSNHTAPSDNMNRNNYNTQAVGRNPIRAPILNLLPKNYPDIGTPNYNNQIENRVNKTSNIQTRSTAEMQHLVSNYEIRDQIHSKKNSGPPILDSLPKNNPDIGMPNYNNQIENRVNKTSNIQTRSTAEMQHLVSNYEIRDQIHSKKKSIPPILDSLPKNNPDIGTPNYNNQIENRVNKTSNLQTRSTTEMQPLVSNYEIRDQIQSKSASVIPGAINNNHDVVQKNAQTHHFSNLINTNSCTDIHRSGNINTSKNYANYSIDPLNPHIRHSPDSTNIEFKEQTQPIDFAIRKTVAIIPNENVIPKSLPTQQKSNVIDTGGNVSNNLNVQNDHMASHRKFDIKQINCSNKTDSLNRSKVEYSPDSTNYQMSPDMITNHDVIHSNINHDPRKKILRRSSVYAPRLQEPISQNNITALQSVSLPPNKANEKDMLNNVELEKDISPVIENTPAINNGANNEQTLNIITNMEINHPSTSNIQNCPLPSVVATHQNISKPDYEYSNMNKDQKSHLIESIKDKITQIMQKCSADEIETLKQLLSNKPIIIEPASQINNVAISVEKKENTNEDKKDTLTPISESNNLNKSESVDLCHNVALLKDNSDTDELKSNHPLMPEEDVKEKKVFNIPTDHNDKSNVCGKCGEAFINQRSLMDHVKTHTLNNFDKSEPVHLSFDRGELKKKLETDVLNQPLISKEIEAVKVVFDKLINNNDVSIQCTKCKNVIFTDSRLLMEHLKTHESKKLNEFKSVNVDRVCSDIPQLKENSTVNDFHKNQLAKRNARKQKAFQKRNRCLKCGDCFNSTSSLINHVKIHSYDNEILSNRNKLRARTKIENDNKEVNENIIQNGNEENLLNPEYSATEAKYDNITGIDNLSMTIHSNNNEISSNHNTLIAGIEIENENKEVNEDIIQNDIEENLLNPEYPATEAECDNITGIDNLNMKIHFDHNEISSNQNTLITIIEFENENKEVNEDIIQNDIEENLLNPEYSATETECDNITGIDNLSMTIHSNDNEISNQNTLIVGTEIENENKELNEDIYQNGNEESLLNPEYLATEAEYDNITGIDNLSMKIHSNDNEISSNQNTLITIIEFENENKDVFQNGNDENLLNPEYSVTEAECGNVTGIDNLNMKIHFNDNEILSNQNTLITIIEFENENKEVNEDKIQNDDEENLLNPEYSVTEVVCDNITGIDNLSMPVIDDDYETYLEMEDSNNNVDNNEEILLEMDVSDMNVDNDEVNLMDVLLLRDCNIQISSSEKALCDANLKHCEYCELKFVSNRDIQQHYKDSHPDVLIHNDYLCESITRKRGLDKRHKASEGSNEKKKAIQRVYSPGKMARTSIISDNERDSNSTCISIYSNSMKTNSDSNNSNKKEKIKNKNATVPAYNVEEKNDKCEIKGKKKDKKKNIDFIKEINKRASYDDDIVYDKISFDTEKGKNEYEKKRKKLKRKLSNKNSDSTDVSISHDLKKKRKVYTKEKKIKNTNGNSSVLPVSPSSNRKETHNSIFVSVSPDFKNNKKATLEKKRDNSSAVSLSIEKKSCELNKKDNVTKNLAVSNSLNINMKNIGLKQELSVIKKCDSNFTPTGRIRKKKMLEEYCYSTNASTSQGYIKRNTYDGNVNMKKRPSSLIPSTSSEYAREENKSDLRKSDIVNYKIKKISSKPSDPQKIKCVICNIIFETKYKLSEHMENVHGNIMADYEGSMFACKECKEDFPNNYFLNKHKKMGCPVLLDTKNNKNDIDLMTSKCIQDDPFQCDICKQKFKSNVMLFEHIQKVHVDDNKLSFTAHDYNFEFLKYHFIMEAPLKDPALKSKLDCKISGNDDVINLKTMTGNIFQCDICGKIFHTKVTLNEHKQKVHVNETEQNNKEMLVDENVHSDDKSSDHDLIKSTSVSNAEIKYVECSVITKNKTILDEHQKKAHTDDKSSLSDLDLMALIINSNSDTYCDKCKKMFETIIDLDEHDQKEHPNKKIRPDYVMNELDLINVLDSKLKCDMCNETFQTKDMLYEHNQKAHANENVPANNESVSNSNLKNLIIGSTISYQCNVCFENFNNSHTFLNHYEMHPKMKKKASTKSF